jgi:hypothetical protein
LELKKAQDDQVQELKRQNQQELEAEFQQIETLKSKLSHLEERKK